MISLNDAISQVEELDSNYHIGAAYFLKLKDMSFEELWEDYLEPLLSDYVRACLVKKRLWNHLKRLMLIQI